MVIKLKIILLALCFISQIVSAREPVVRLPTPDFKLLISPDFQVRQEFQRSLIPWIVHDPLFAQYTLINLYKQSSQPEIKARLYRLIERAYFPITGYLGIRMSNQSPVRNLKDGVLISDVVKGTPAERFGLKMNDRILKINQWEAKAHPLLNNQLVDQIRSYRTGALIKVVVLRGAEEMEIDFRLGVFPTPSEMIRESQAQGMRVDRRTELDYIEFREWFERHLTEINQTS